MTLDDALRTLPLVAILRGLNPDEAVEIVGVLVEEGFRLIEIPLNSPEPFESIGRVVRAHGEHALVGAGTVLTVAEVGRLGGLGASLVVSPNMDAAVIRATKAQGMVSLPGVATPTEAFAALAAGADGLKAFPAEGIPAVLVKAWRAVIPASVPLLPVGGITPETMGPYVAAGASGFGLGSALYKPGLDAAGVRANARAFVRAWGALAAG